jgi:AcrR family transcriptional regulator
MSSASPAGRRRAGDRRREVLEAAVGVFGERGYAAPAAAIARRAGVSEAYLFRLFATKRALFLACHDAVLRRVLAVLEEAAGAGGDAADRGRRMLAAYRDAISADERRLQLHVHAAAADPLIRGAAQAGLRATLDRIASLATGEPVGAHALYAELMLMNLADLIDPTPSHEPGAADARAVSP